MLFNIKNEIKKKGCMGRIAYYSFFIALFSFPLAELKTFALSYIITDIFTTYIVGYFSKKLKIKLEKNINIKILKLDLHFRIINCLFLVVIIVNIFFGYVFYKKVEMFFSYVFFITILIASLIPLENKPFKTLKLDSEKKLMLISYFVYTTILVVIKCTFNNLGIPIKNIIHIDVSYIEYQLIVCTVYLDKVRNMYSLNLIGGTKEDIEKFEQIVEKNKHNPKLNYDNNKKLIEEWKKYLEEDNPELENTIEKLSGINKEFFKDEKRKLDERIDRFTGNKKQKEELKSIKKRKINENEILVLEFVLYKTDIEEIIGETDD